MEHLVQKVGAIAGAAMPLFNISLIMRIIKRKSSSDISLIWCLGVWMCIVLMTPSVFITEDITLKAFGLSNIVFFTMVVFFVVKYRNKDVEKKGDV